MDERGSEEKPAQRYMSKSPKGAVNSPYNRHDHLRGAREQRILDLKLRKARQLKAGRAGKEVLGRQASRTSKTAEEPGTRRRRAFLRGSGGQLD